MSTGLPNFGDTRLLADVGGTNARFALLTDSVITDVRVLEGSAYPTFLDAVRAYLAQVQAAPVKAAALAIAAPLSGDEVNMTNSTWRFSVAMLRTELRLDRLIVLNDFTALAMALRHLPADELKQVGGLNPVGNAPIALIGPGTGLGVSGLIPSEGAWTPLQGEGGHVTLPSCSEREGRIIERLRLQFGHLSAERVLSGPGLVNLYAALGALDGVPPRAIEPSEVTSAALARSDEQCVEALDIFCALLGTVAGDLALTIGAFGGVYIGGGIVPRLGDYFARSKFRSRFEAKGRYEKYLAPIPVYVIHSALPAFFGLARAFVDPGPRIEAKQ
jgi:glucokinase